VGFQRHWAEASQGLYRGGSDILLSSLANGMEQVLTSSNHHEKFRRRVLPPAVALLLAGLVVVPSLFAQQSETSPTLTYIKVMKGSVPEYTSLTVSVNGDGTYDGRRLDESPRPRSLKLSPETTGTLFQMAAALDDFQSIQLESHKKVASLGLKTFIYRHNGQENKVEFNYTRNKRAEELLNIFEGIADVEQHIGTLEYSSRYDVLGLPSALTRVEIDLDNKALVDPQLMVPILKKIAGDSQYLHIAQVRAVDILRRIQGSRYSSKEDQR
jgi:hypothetical protein